MKTINRALMASMGVLVMLLFTACGFMQKSTTSNTSAAEQTTATTQTTATQTATPTNAAQDAGQGAGTALQALYTQYKADGNKYDYKNLQNIMNTLSLVSNCEGLKDNYKNTTYLAEFGKGLLVGSLGLVTEDNVEKVTNSLVDMVKNNETVQDAQSKVQSGASTLAGYANTTSQYASALSTLLGLFAK